MSDADIRFHLSQFCAADKAQDWQTVEEEALPATVKIRHRSCALKRKWVQVSCHIGVPFDFAKKVVRPEVLSLYPVLANDLMDYELVEQLAPGDCMVKLTLPALTRVLGDVLVGQHGPGAHNVRIATFHDAPQPSEVTCVCVGLGADWLDFAHAASTAQYMHYAPGEDAGSTIVSYTFPTAWHSYPSFFNTAAKVLASASENFSKVLVDQMPSLHATVDQFYTFLSLRGCCRGPPLLPCDERSEITSSERIGGYYWQPSDKGCSAFPVYLQKMITACGSSARVFNTLDGQRLVPYQVAVLSSEWSQAEGALRKLFAAQCSAYRFMKGGSGAPKLKVDLEPRFSFESTPLSEPTRLSVDDFMIFKMENKTFVDFQLAQDSFVKGPVARKAAEYP
eukprot:TRINITY_DN13075_c0_g2_i2.p1 TRINITY_DN13075_c0_g2~~TRINITY_DN13075_c0_g2_i2.p1  ORF type:complete len:393 (-),score=39.39 TRINITY_DN13075_c0_g2_i2:86-1264(-)